DGGYGGAGVIASLLGLFMNGGSTQYSYPNMDNSAGNYGDPGRPGVMGRGTGSSARRTEARKESRPADKVRDYLYGPVPKEKEKEKAPARERLQPTATEIISGVALNDLLAQTQKRPADEGAKQPADAGLALDDQVLK